MKKSNFEIKFNVLLTLFRLIDDFLYYKLATLELHKIFDLFQ